MVCAMESLDGKQDGRKRKMKFDQLQLEVLVEDTNKRIDELQQRNLNITKKTQYGRISAIK